MFSHCVRRKERNKCVFLECGMKSVLQQEDESVNVSGFGRREKVKTSTPSSSKLSW